MKWLSPETLYQTPRMPGSLQQPVNLPLTRRNESGQIENYGELETAAVESRDQDRGGTGGSRVRNESQRSGKS